MRSSVVVLASVIGLAIAQKSPCTDYEKARECITEQVEKEQSCLTILAEKQCMLDYCPEIGVPDDLNHIIDICENGGKFPGTGSSTGSETTTASGSESTSSGGSTTGGTCTDAEAFSKCVNPIAKLEQTCDVLFQGLECFDKYCPQRAYQIEDDIAACKAAGSGTSKSGSTKTSSADDSESTGFDSGIPGGSSTQTTTAADSTNTSSDSEEPSTTSDSEPTNTRTSGDDGPVSTDTSDNEGAGDRLLAPVTAIIGSLVAVMAWL
ncbi:hypothetical protein O988_00070 [Pseudogymnoascus sp. VKM F-3808]|nr:hypothetical protein O988_00070 [Pseudogymnoascus sp. VKM F-3808]